MNNKRSTLVHDLLFVGLLLGCATSIVLAQENISFDDVIVLTVPHGQGLGKVTVNCGSGGCDVPRCFCIDANGLFYVPEINCTNKGWKDIRIHKFSSDGTPIEVVNVEGIADSILYMTTSANGEIYLLQEVIGLAETYIGHYDNNGRLINRFGRDGEITKGEFDKMIYGDPRKEFVRKKCFFAFHPTLVFGAQNDTLYAAGRLFDSNEPDTYKFNTKSGVLLEKTLKNDNLPQEVTIYRNKYAERLSLRNRIDKDTLFRMRSPYIGIVGPDGEYYYM